MKFEGQLTGVVQFTMSNTRGQGSGRQKSLWMEDNWRRRATKRWKDTSKTAQQSNNHDTDEVNLINLETGTSGDSEEEEDRGHPNAPRREFGGRLVHSSLHIETSTAAKKQRQKSNERWRKTIDEWWKILDESWITLGKEDWSSRMELPASTPLTQEQRRRGWAGSTGNLVQLQEYDERNEILDIIELPINGPTTEARRARTRTAFAPHHMTRRSQACQEPEVCIYCKTV